jgi:ribosome-associated translation inhibitor RaiA
MRINIYAEGFQLTSQLRAFVDLRLLSTLGPFRDRIESTVVHLRARNARSVPDTTSSDVVVRLYPSGEVRARAQQPRMEDAIDQAAKEIGVRVENAVSEAQPASVPSRVVEKAIGHGALEVVLDGNRISQLQREMLERPKNYLRPVVVREYWRPPGAENDERPEERETALATLA